MAYIEQRVKELKAAIAKSEFLALTEKEKGSVSSTDKGAKAMKAEEIRALPDKHGIYKTTTGGYSCPDGAEIMAALVLVEIAAQLAELNEILKSGNASMDIRVDGCVRTS